MLRGKVYFAKQKKVFTKKANTINPAFYTSLNATIALCPPKPNVLLIATFTL